MASLPDYYLSPEEYLSLERRAEFKSEYVDGVVYETAGGSERHNLITANLIVALGVQLRERPCRVYPSNLKVRLPNSRRCFYPDVSVVCGETQFADEERDVILNPFLIVEVLSDSTEAFIAGRSSPPTSRSTRCANTSLCRRANFCWSTISDRRTAGSTPRRTGWTPSFSCPRSTADSP